VVCHGPGRVKSFLPAISSIASCLPNFANLPTMTI
jgi:hypothetical protein